MATSGRNYSAERSQRFSFKWVNDRNQVQGLAPDVSPTMDCHQFGRLLVASPETSIVVRRVGSGSVAAADSRRRVWAQASRVGFAHFRPFSDRGPLWRGQERSQGSGFAQQAVTDTADPMGSLAPPPRAGDSSKAPALGRGVSTSSGPLQKKGSGTFTEQRKKCRKSLSPPCLRKRRQLRRAGCRTSNN